MTNDDGFRTGKLTIIFLIAALSVSGFFSRLKAQDTYWGLSADLGTSLNKTRGDTLTSQGFLLPTYGLSVVFGKVISHGIGVNATLGYRNRGGVTKANSVINPGKDLTLGSYQVHTRDHFLTNDLSLLLNAKYWKVLGLIPFLSIGVRNDFYLTTNSKTTSSSAYFKPETSGLSWGRSRHHRNYVVGLTGTTGLQIEQWSIGLAYYHQLSGAFSIPSTVSANYAQVYSKSLQLNVSYRF